MKAVTSVGNSFFLSRNLNFNRYNRYNQVGNLMKRRLQLESGGKQVCTLSPLSLSVSQSFSVSFSMLKSSCPKIGLDSYWTHLNAPSLICNPTYPNIHLTMTLSMNSRCTFKLTTTAALRTSRKETTAITTQAQLKRSFREGNYRRSYLKTCSAVSCF